MNTRLSALLPPALGAAVLFAFLPRPAGAGDAFIRGGAVVHPRDIGLEGRWRVGFGSDYAVNLDETIFVGLEVQTSVYRQDVVGGGTATFVPLNGLVNVKVKSSALDVRPYGGGGIGLLSQVSRIEGASEWESDLGFQLLGGVELGRLNLELQLQRAFQSGAQTAFAFYAGFIF